MLLLTPLIDMAQGLRALRKGLACYRRDRSLWSLLLAMMLINLAFLGLFLLTMRWGGSELIDFALSLFPPFEVEQDGFFWAALNALLSALFSLVKVLLWLALFIASLLIFFALASIANAPLYDLVSERIEERLTGKPLPDFSLSRFLRHLPELLKTEAKKALFFVAVPLLLLACQLVPIVGALAYLVAANLFLMWGQGFLYADFAMARRMWTFRQSLRWAVRHGFALAGLGITALIPFASFFLAPLLVAGGTVLFLERESLIPSGGQPGQIDRSGR